MYNLNTKICDFNTNRRSGFLVQIQRRDDCERTLDILIEFPRPIQRSFDGIANVSEVRLEAARQVVW